MSNMNHKYLSSHVSLALFTTLIMGAAQADDDDWDGFYIGANLGYGWADADTRFTSLSGAYGHSPYYAPEKIDPDPNGILGGAQAGYNWQIERWVLGLETDFSFADINGNNTTLGTSSYSDGYTAAVALSTEERINSFGTLRARLGMVAFEDFLVYATGGWAYGDVNYSANTDYSAVDSGKQSYPAHSFSESKSGWTVGGGLEYGLLESLSLRAEYLYLDLGDTSAVANPEIPNPPYHYKKQYDWETRANIARVGFNYFFDI